MTGFNGKNRGNLKYLDVATAGRPVAHCDEIPVPVVGERPDISDEDSSSVKGKDEVVLADDTPHTFFFQKEANLSSSRSQLV